MLRNDDVKKVTKKFSNFAGEEQWLQSMLKDGWILKSYDLDDLDDCLYVFEPVKSEEQRNLIYRIDFREFNKTAEFVEYKTTIEKAGWILLSRNKYYSKHIFYSERTNSDHDVLPGQNSNTEREQRKMSSSLVSALISFSLFIISVVLYIIFDRTSIMGAGLFLLIYTAKFILDYFKHREVYRRNMGTVRTFH